MTGKPPLTATSLLRALYCGLKKSSLSYFLAIQLTLPLFSKRVLLNLVSGSCKVAKLSACVAISARPLHKIDNFYIFSEQRGIVPLTSVMTERDGIVLCRLISFISDQNYCYNLMIFARTDINALRKSYI